MTFQAVTGLPVQYQANANTLASGHYLKFYQANTVIPLSMATDATGGTTLAQCKLSNLGYPITDPDNNDSVFVPHIDADYRAVLYANLSDATADLTANAVWNVADLSVVTAKILVTGIPKLFS